MASPIPNDSGQADPSTLDRALGPADAAALVISNVIGVGIFTTPGVVAQLVPHPLAMLGVWVVGGALALAGASAYASLAALRPQAGGEYVYLREAFGPLAAFLTGWTSFVAGFSGAIAAGAVGLADYLGRYFPAAADTHSLLALPLYFARIEISPQKVVAIVVICTISAVHIRGLRPGRLMQNTLTSVKVLALMALVVFGFSLGTGSLDHLGRAAGTVRPLSWLLALIPVMFAYSGWNAAAYVAEEVRDPVRNVPRALAWGTGAVVALYLLLNVLYVYALPMSQLKGVVRTGDAAAVALFGPRGANALTPLLLVALGGGISAMVLAGPRVYFAMARDGLFFRATAQVHPRYRTPAVAIAAQALWSCLLVLSGTFEGLLIYTGFAVVLFAGLAVAGLFVLRRRHQGALPHQCWGYPIGPAVFVIASLAMVLNAIRERPQPSLIGLGIMAAGVPIYWWFRKRNAVGSK